MHGFAVAIPVRVVAVEVGFVAVGLRRAIGERVVRGDGGARDQQRDRQSREPRGVRGVQGGQGHGLSRFLVSGVRRWRAARASMVAEAARLLHRFPSMQQVVPSKFINWFLVANRLMLTLHRFERG